MSVTPTSAPLKFPPTVDAALARIAAVRPGDYARSRNAIEGAVTQLSPYITHGFVTLPEVLAGVAAKYRLDVQHKLVYELGWRAYFRHVWEHQGDGIFQSLHPGPLPDEAYASHMPADIREARTGVPAIDLAVRTLYATGYLHNHARMWLASYAVHLRKVHWRVGADWMFGHLLDGDLASNHLSWQWVAGTASHKPYLFNAENVAKYAPPEWHSPGSAIDQNYEAMHTIAHQPQAISPTDHNFPGATEPELATDPPAPSWVAPNPLDLAGRDVWLVHPWAMGRRPVDLPPHCLHLGWWPQELHRVRPWSPARWAFVGARMTELAPLTMCSDRAGLALALSGARSAHTMGNPHIDHLLPSQVQRRLEPSLFGPVNRPCASFSQWWTRATRNVQDLQQLPGLAAMCEERPVGPLFE